MNTPDIAGLCERLRAITTTDHERLCQGREYACSCGWDAENEAKATKAADTIERQSAEIERLRGAAQALIDRWETPLWKDVPATAVFIANLKAALTGEES